jgi:hypothetical protein
MAQTQPPDCDEIAAFDHALPGGRVIAIGTGLAAILAVSVSAQTYLSMLGHGHSFRRILLWQLGTWTFWALAAPFVLRRGAELTGARPDLPSRVRLVALGLSLFGLHSVIATQLTLWIQPFVPVVSYDFIDAFANQLPARFAIDLLTFGLLVVAGGALRTRHRARQLELRESRLEAELARAQLHALRLEIEPHFLFNTLNAITALVRLKDNSRAVEVLVGLADFMRTTLDGPADQLVPLSREMAWVKRYVGLQQARFGDRLQVDYRIGDGCADVLVPTLLLQPIVENALRHGAARQSAPCRVEIAAALANRTLTVTVADDGAGLPNDFDLARAAGTGLRNVRSRLHHLYGATASLDVRRGERAGTTVEVAVPIAPPAWQGRATA